MIPLLLEPDNKTALKDCLLHPGDLYMRVPFEYLGSQILSGANGNENEIYYMQM